MKYITTLTENQLKKLEEFNNEPLSHDFSDYIDEVDLQFYYELLKDAVYLELYKELSSQYLATKKEEMLKDIQEMIVPIYKLVSNMPINHKIETILDLIVPDNIDKLKISAKVSIQNDEEKRICREKELISFKKNNLEKENIEKSFIDRIKSLAEEAEMEVEI